MSHVTRRIVSVMVACWSMPSQAQPIHSSKQLRDSVASAMIVLEEQSGRRIIPVEHNLVIDASALDAILEPLGFMRDRTGETKSLVGTRNVRLKAWRSTATCTERLGIRKCTLPGVAQN